MPRMFDIRRKRHPISKSDKAIALVSLAEDGGHKPTFETFPHRYSTNIYSKRLGRIQTTAAA